MRRPLQHGLEGLRLNGQPAVFVLASLVVALLAGLLTLGKAV